MAYKKVVVKLGSNVLTNAAGLLDVRQMSHIVEQLAVLHKQQVGLFVVSSGAVAAGTCVGIHFDDTDDEIQRRQVASSLGQPQLMRTYQDLFHHHGLSVGQILLTKLDISTRSHYLNIRRCIEGLLSKNIIPIINENDATAVSELMFTDNDEIAGLVSSMVDADTLIICTNVDGVYSGDPSDETSVVLEEVAADADMRAMVASTKSSFGRGGMLTKIHIAQKLAHLGSEVHIVNGKKENAIREAFAGEKIGTTIRATKKSTSKKRWLAFSEQAGGRIIVNTRLEQELRTGNKAISILPVGLTAVENTFKKGEVIEIANEKGEVFGAGIAQKDSSTVAAECGKQNKGHVVHYNELYVR